ncbi:hypothetical protein SteCoe_10013 [Stentor coeruleus]|uniref:Uncharacterized protein n=1 Tax=Stentor coeruleus TaxID=5963 RepID=A0A1R2CGI6_9CILI|nr:hypothetical protein SteCoe_10013 [Stentor coeruleus]
MEGSFFSEKCRAKLIQKSRKSNLILGKTDGPFITTQKSFFKSYGENNSPHNYSHKRTSSHVVLGSDRYLMSTESGASFCVQNTLTKKNKPKIHYSNKSNIIMGKQNMIFIPSSTKYKSLNISPAQSCNNSPSKSRKHNFNFGNDTVKKTTVMQSNFGPLQTQQIEKIDKGMLNSHISFGGHPKMYKSVAVSEFSKKIGEPGKLPSEKVAELKKEHFILGNDEVFLSSNQSASYRENKFSKQRLTNEQLQNLKSSHFSFSAEYPDYMSSTKAAMNYKPAEVREQEWNHKQNHIVLGDYKNKFSSSYMQNFALNNNYIKSQSQWNK